MTRPVPVISNTPSSPVAPKRCLSARRTRRPTSRSPSKDNTESTKCSRTRGPANEPSLVTWPTSTTAQLFSRAAIASRCAHWRTWATEPGADDRSGSNTVWIESIMARPGLRSAISASTPLILQSPPTCTPSPASPSLAKRPDTCCGDSSADTESAGECCAAHDAVTCVSNVDLPTPGSPPTRVMDPATRPPPSTRSNSTTPVGSGTHARSSSSASGTAGR